MIAPFRFKCCLFKNKGVPLAFTSAVFAAEVRKSPHVAQSDRVANARQEKVKLPGPRFPVRQLLLLLDFHHQGLGLVIGRGRLVQLGQHVSVGGGFRPVARHLSGFGRAPDRRAGEISSAPRRQQLRARGGWDEGRGREMARRGSCVEGV